MAMFLDGDVQVQETGGEEAMAPKFTWIHGNIAEQRFSARLDKRFCDDNWRQLFPEAVVTCIHAHSDRCSLIH